MNNNGIVSKKTNKRDAGSFLLFVFLLPYVCACLWGHVGEEAGNVKRTESEYLVEASVEWGVWEMPLEEYLVYRLCQVMPEEYGSEAEKAQAVLLRTEMAALFAEQGKKRVAVDGEGLAKFYKEGGTAREESLKKSRQAVEETEGVILTCRGEPIRASYFRVSNGSTRDAGEECPYLSAVSCEQDREAPDYRSVVRVDRETYKERLRGILEKDFDEETLWKKGNFSFDDAGYMTRVSYTDENGETERIDGETFRHLFGLASASFEMREEEEQIVFQVTGVGHGFGMSQYAAKCMAENGESYDKILAAFFFETELTKIE